MDHMYIYVTKTDVCMSCTACLISILDTPTNNRCVTNCQHTHKSRNICMHSTSQSRATGHLQAHWMHQWTLGASRTVYAHMSPGPQTCTHNTRTSTSCMRKRAARYDWTSSCACAFDMTSDMVSTCHVRIRLHQFVGCEIRLYTFVRTYCSKLEKVCLDSGLIMYIYMYIYMYVYVCIYKCMYICICWCI